MHRLNHDIDKISPEEWAQHFWRGRWENTNYHQYLLLNHLWFGHGRYASFKHGSGLRENENCIRGVIQTPQRVLNCRIIEIRGDLRNVDEDFIYWMDNNKLLENATSI